MDGYRKLAMIEDIFRFNGKGTGHVSGIKGTVLTISCPDGEEPVPGAKIRVLSDDGWFAPEFTVAKWERFRDILLPFSPHIGILLVDDLASRWHGCGRGDVVYVPE